MSVLEIIKYPDERLREKAIEIKEINANIRKLAMDMVETMYNAKGVGLAATQVGVSYRLIVIDVAQLEDKPNPIICINPVIKSSEGKMKSDEGCLSVPGYTAPVERFYSVNVEYIDIEGNAHNVTAEDFLSKAFQHEIDHLNGIVFVDRLSRLRRELFLKRLKKSMEKKL